MLISIPAFGSDRLTAQLFWGQPQIEVMVRVDDAHGYHGWNWVRDRFLSMDKGTTRALLGANVFNVQIPGRYGPEIAEFSPSGLDLGQVKQSCDLTGYMELRGKCYTPANRKECEHFFAEQK